MGTGKSKNERDMEYLENNSTLIGTRPLELVDPETGQVLEMIQTTKLRYGSKPFWKCYLKEFLAAMESLSGREFDVFIFIVKNAKQSDNKFIGTYDKIMKATGCSRKVIAKTLKSLQECNFIRKVQNGIWMINPHILMKGDGQKQLGLWREYGKPLLDEDKEAEKEKEDSSGEKQGEEVSGESSSEIPAENSDESSEENSKEISEENCGDTNITDDSNRETDFDESHLPGQK